jgi:hypothetical protein
MQRQLSHPIKSLPALLRPKIRRGVHLVSAAILTGAALPLGLAVPAHALTDSLILTPVADTYIDSNNPNANFGSASTLYASTTAYRTFYKFDTTQLPSSATVNYVQLGLYNINSHVSGGNVIYQSQSAWGESTATWNNPPTYNTTAIATSATPTSPNTYMYTSLPTTSVNAANMSSFAVGYSTSGLQHQLSSRENSTWPQLIVNYTTTGTDDVIPTTPTISGSSLTDNGQTVSWSGASDDVALQWYYIYRNGELIHVSASTDSSYTDSNGLPATNYTYMVRSVDSSGNVSGDSNTLSVRTTGKPNTVDFSMVSVTSTTATVKAHMNANGLTTTANFAYGTTSALGSTTSNQNIGNGTSPVQVDETITGLSPNTTYYFRVQGSNTSGGSYPNPITFTTAP